MRIWTKDLPQGAQWEEIFFGCHHLQFEQPRMVHKNGAFTLVKNIQAQRNWNPAAPHTEFAIELYECVKSYLPTHQHQLRLYCAIGSALDVYYGCDGLFEWTRGKIVTFDLSCSIKPRYKADVLITPDEEGVKMWRLGESIAKRLYTTHKH